MTPKTENRCICCGTIIPEGRQVCPSCEWESERDDEGGESNADTGSDQSIYRE